MFKGFIRILMLVQALSNISLPPPFHPCFSLFWLRSDFQNHQGASSLFLHLDCLVQLTTPSFFINIFLASLITSCVHPSLTGPFVSNFGVPLLCSSSKYCYDTGNVSEVHSEEWDLFLHTNQPYLLPVSAVLVVLFLL